VLNAGVSEDAAMPSGPNERFDFFLSRRGSVAAIAREVIGDEFSSKWLELLKETVPNVSRVAILCTEAWIEGTNSACGGHIASRHPLRLTPWRR
jgi:hypothetical protein